MHLIHIRTAEDDVKASYLQLLDEHDAIANAARGLLADLADDEVSAALLSQQLDGLANMVEDHIEVEDGVVAEFDNSRLVGPWVDAWHDSLVAFESLKADWLAFLGAWPRQAIEGDRRGFWRAATAILARRRERIQLETRAFYATAFQTGAIDLR